MKRLNLIFIVTAFFAMTTACTEAEKLSPDFPIGNEILRLSGSNAQNMNAADINSSSLVIGQAPTRERAELLSSKMDLFNKNKDQYRGSDEGGEFYYGELMPLSFNDCGIFIQKTDGSFLEVQNTDIPGDILDAGGWVEFSYNADEALEGPCGLGVMVHLTYISLVEDEVNDEAHDETPKSLKR